jgi:hypothetical protein
MNCAISEPFLTLHFQARPSYGTFQEKARGSKRA